MEEEPDPRNVNAPYRHPDNIGYEVEQQRIANATAERDIQIKREASKTPEQREKEKVKEKEEKKAWVD